MSHTIAPHRPRNHRRHRSAMTAAVIAAVALSACGGGDDSVPVAEAVEGAAASTSQIPFGLVTPTEAAELAATSGITVIDVRTPEEFAEGHLEGATLIDFYSDTFADDVAALDPDGEYLVYCRSGNRSGQATAIMEQLGIDRVYDLDGGVLAWGGQSLPLSP